MAKKYQVATWNPTSGDFTATNEQLIKDMVKDAVANKVNMLIIGGEGCTMCVSLFNEAKNKNSSINKDFLFKQEIYLVSSNWPEGVHPGRKITAALQSALGSSNVTITTSGDTSYYPCYFVIDTQTTGKAKAKIFYGVSSISKSNIVSTIGDVPIKTYFTVTFKDYNGTILSTVSVEKNKDAVPPTEPTRPGHKFTGWSPPYTNITSNLTVTAQYAVSDPSLNQKKYILDSYCFSMKRSCQVITKDNMQLQYSYPANTLAPAKMTVRFDGNGHTGGVQQDISVSPGSRWTCPSCSFTRSGWSFSGSWNTKADGTGSTYTPGQTYDCPSENITLYATWQDVKPGTYVVLAATQTSPGCSTLTGMDNDINRVKALLPSSIPASNIIELRNSSCTTANIKKHLEIGKEYELLIYMFSDHGGTSDNGVMCTYDGRFKSADFYSIVSQAKGRVFAIFACCHAEDQYQATSPYALASALSSTSQEKVTVVADQDNFAEKGQFDWAQGAIDYFNNLKKQQDAIKQRIENAKKKGLLMAASPADNAVMAANATPNMLCWCACKKSQVSYMSRGTGHYFITGLVNNFNSSKSYSDQWSAFATKSPAKGSTDGNTYTPVKAVLGTSFESKKTFT